MGNEILDTLYCWKMCFSALTFEVTRSRCSYKFCELPRNTHVVTKVSFVRLPGCNFIKKETPRQVFPVNFAKILRAPLLQNKSRRLILSIARILLTPKKETIKRCSMKCVIFHSLIYHTKLPENLPKYLKQTNERVSLLKIKLQA